MTYSKEIDYTARTFANGAARVAHDSDSSAYSVVYEAVFSAVVEVCQKEGWTTDQLLRATEKAVEEAQERILQGNAPRD